MFFFNLKFHRMFMRQSNGLRYWIHVIADHELIEKVSEKFEVLTKRPITRIQS